MTRHLDVLLLLALPASGKSEVRRYLASLDPAECHEHFGLGPTVQLDDFPYVHMMRRISDEMTDRGLDGGFFLSPALPFREPRDWGTLIELLDEDYDDLLAGRRPEPDSAAQWLIARFDRAREKVGARPALADVPQGLRDEIAQAVEDESRDLLVKKNAEHPDSLEGKTVLLEFARGGADGSPLPLPAPYGYRYSLSRLDPRILERAAVLYIQVTPEESRRKNADRTDPDDPGSILHHGVPNAVMYGDYGCDDMQWLIETSEVPNTLRVETEDGLHHLPVGIFDNRADLTSFLRAEPDAWDSAQVARLRDELSAAFGRLHAARHAP